VNDGLCFVSSVYIYISHWDIINKDKQIICYFVQIVLDIKIGEVCHYLKRKSMDK
jgi:hypothetical protein